MHFIPAAAAIVLREQNGVPETPPGFVLLSQIAALGSLENILNEFANAPPVHYTPQLVALPDGACSVYQDDAAYDSYDLELPGPRYRLWMRGSGWVYECGRNNSPTRFDHK